MMRLIGLTLIFVFFTSSAFAAPKAYIRGMDSLFGKVKLVTDKGEEELVVHGNTSDISKLFEGNKEAMKAADLSTEYAMTGHGIFLGSIIGSILLTSSNGSSAAGTSLIVLLAGVFSGGYFFSKSADQVYKAINLYNGVEENKSINAFNSNEVPVGLKYTFAF